MYFFSCAQAGVKPVNGHEQWTNMFKENCVGKQMGWWMLNWRWHLQSLFPEISNHNRIKYDPSYLQQCKIDLGSHKQPEEPWFMRPSQKCVWTAIDFLRIFSGTGIFIFQILFTIKGRSWDLGGCTNTGKPAPNWERTAKGFWQIMTLYRSSSWKKAICSDEISNVNIK